MNCHTVTEPSDCDLGIPEFWVLRTQTPFVLRIVDKFHLHSLRHVMLTVFWASLLGTLGIWGYPNRCNRDPDL